MRKLFALSLCIITLSLVTSCYKDNLAEMTIGTSLTATSGGTLGNNTCNLTNSILFATDVAPILQTNCGTNNSCHGSRNSSGVNLSSYAGVKSAVGSGRLMNSINWAGGASRMPQGGYKLNDCSISKIQKWIDAGALNN